MNAESSPKTFSARLSLPHRGYIEYTDKYPLKKGVELVGVKYTITIPKWRVFGFIIPFGEMLTHEGECERAIVKRGCIKLVDEEENDRESSWFYPFKTEISFGKKRILRVKGDHL